MMKYFIVSLTFFCSCVFAADMPEMAKVKNCVGCHAVESTLVGPAFVDVANRYRGFKDAPQTLSEKILQGSTGEWGSVSMPPQNITKEEAIKLAKYILKLR